MTEFTEFLTSRELLYYPFILLTCNIIVTFVPYFIMNYFEIIANEDNPRFSKTQSILQIAITSLLTFILIYQLTTLCFPDQFSYLVEDSLSNNNDKTLENLEKKNANVQLIIICVILGFLDEKIMAFYFEYLTSSNNLPAKILIRSCEIGPCFNLITANIIQSIAYPIGFFLIIALFFAGYGILGYFGLSLMSLGALANIVPVYSLNFLGNVGANAQKLAILAKFTEPTLEKLHNVFWYPQNYRAFLRGMMFLAVILGGIGAAGNFLCFLNEFDLIIMKSLQNVGLLIGFVTPHLLNGLIINGTHVITTYTVIKVFY